MVPKVAWRRLAAFARCPDSEAGHSIAVGQLMSGVGGIEVLFDDFSGGKFDVHQAFVTDRQFIPVIDCNAHLEFRLAISGEFLLFGSDQEHIRCARAKDADCFLPAHIAEIVPHFDFEQIPLLDFRDIDVFMQCNPPGVGHAAHLGGWNASHDLQGG